ncbi:hypothetical protein AaE_011509, partial [Aphanomyces astaci]
MCYICYFDEGPFIVELFIGYANIPPTRKRQRTPKNDRGRVTGSPPAVDEWQPPRGGFYTPATTRGIPAVAEFVSAAAPPTTEADGASVPLPADNDPSDARDDTDMSSDGGYGRTAPQVWNVPATPQPPTFSGSKDALLCATSDSFRYEDLGRGVSRQSYVGRDDAFVGTRPSGVGTPSRREYGLRSHDEVDRAGIAEDVVRKQLQRNKALKSDAFRYVNWLRTFAAGHQLYVGLDNEPKPSRTAKPVEAPRGGKTQVSRREGGREDAAKNNGRVGGKAETIVPKNAEPPASKGCLKCGDMSHRVARCPKTAPSEAETLLAAQPQRQKTERGVLLENIVRVDDVLLDSGSDVTVVTRGVMDALDAAGVEVGIVSHSVPHFVYPYGSDAKQVVMTRSVKFNCVTLDTTCGPLVLRGLKAWVDDTSTATELIVSRPVIELLGFSVEDFLVGARKQKEEWDVSSVPTNELFGMANVKRLMAEKLNPPELDPDDGLECATPEGAVQAFLTSKAAEAETRGLAPAEATRLHDLLAKVIDVFREDLG